MVAQRDPHEAPAIRAFAITLQKMRDAAGLTKAQLAETLGYTPQFMGQIEFARNIPSMTFAQDLDTFFKIDALFYELWLLIKGTRRVGAAPVDFARYVELEKTAATLRMFETRLLPGLFQTDAYARAAMGVNPDAEEAGKERRELFERPDPPHVFLVVDERALHREIGSPEVVREQFAQLLELIERPEVSFQVLPQDTRYSGAFSGSFTVLGFASEADVVYIESAGLGNLIGDPAAVADCAIRFDLLRGHAYSVTESRSMVEKALARLK
jgi:transcriptional regulator with XRE-family HTH domain